MLSCGVVSFGGGEVAPGLGGVLTVLGGVFSRVVVTLGGVLSLEADFLGDRTLSLAPAGGMVSLEENLTLT